MAPEKAAAVVATRDDEAIGMARVDVEGFLDLGQDRADQAVEHAAEIGIMWAELEIMAMLLRRIDFVNRMALRVDRGHGADLVRAGLEMRDQLTAKRGAEYAGNMQYQRRKDQVLPASRGRAAKAASAISAAPASSGSITATTRAAIHDDDDGGLVAAEAPANKDGFAKNDV
ncbi:MAG: hypothetical protein WAV18_12005 [Roseiarcus sp.]